MQASLSYYDRQAKYIYKWINNSVQTFVNVKPFPRIATDIKTTNSLIFIKNLKSCKKIEVSQINHRSQITLKVGKKEIITINQKWQEMRKRKRHI